MVTSSFDPHFKRQFKKIKNKGDKDKLIKLFKKLRNDPELGKPMRYSRKGTREVYVSPYRLSYAYIKDEDRIIFLDLYHKDEQ